MKFPESALAHKYLDGLKGIEIGGAAHNSFGLDTLNVDRLGSMDTHFKKYEIEMCGEAMNVDIVAEGNRLPLPDKSYDFVISSHVIEHFYDPISALLEWARVARKYLYIIVPHRQRTFDAGRELTIVAELHERYKSGVVKEDEQRGEHWSVFEPSNFNELCVLCGLHVIEIQDPDDKVGNGFAFVIKLD
ncbi:MAG TPA: methyltransferase domain-containing protein [Bacteroidales bacterium]|mgnify:CR=1 FL=1|nr:methyltransferase domain-containing protein [Bacteroidales bacterium]